MPCFIARTRACSGDSGLLALSNSAIFIKVFSQFKFSAPAVN
jgi:hypothetical protein